MKSNGSFSYAQSDSMSSTRNFTFGGTLPSPSVECLYYELLGQTDRVGWIGLKSQPITWDTQIRLQHSVHLGSLSIGILPLLGGARRLQSVSRCTLCVCQISKQTYQNQWPRYPFPSRGRSLAAASRLGQGRVSYVTTGEPSRAACPGDRFLFHRWGAYTLENNNQFTVLGKVRRGHLLHPSRYLW